MLGPDRQPLQGLTKTVAMLNPHRASEPERCRAGRLAVLVSLIIAVAAAVYMLFFVAFGVWLAAVGAGIAASWAVGGLVAFQRHERVALVGHGLAGSDLVALMAVIWATGGLFSVAVSWLAIVPMVASIVEGRRAGMTWAIPTLIWIAALWGLDAAGLTPIDTMPAWINPTFVAIAPFGLIVCTFAITWNYAATNDEAVARSEAASQVAQAARKQAEEAHVSARAVLDHVAQGMVIVDEAGCLGAARSSALDRWFGIPEPGARVWDLLRARSETIADTVELGWQQVSEGVLPRELALDQLPRRLASGDQILELEWCATTDDEGMMLVATDVTARERAENERAKHEEVAALLSRFGANRSPVAGFLAEARTIVAAVVAGEGSPAQEHRWIHTLKGNCAVMGLGTLARWLHELESAIDERRGRASADERAELSRRWNELDERLRTLIGDDASTVQVDRDELQVVMEMVAGGADWRRISTRMQGWTWDRVDCHLEHLADQARRIATTLGKQVEVAVEAGDLRTPPSREWMGLWSAMVHLVRNAVDHGIEDDREERTKPVRGTIRLGAEVAADSVRLEIEDDGRGIDWQAIGAKARAVGLPFATRDDRVNALFSDGVTSRAEIDELSGRGVGTSALREAVDRVGGQIDVESEAGCFTRFTIVAPLPHGRAGVVGPSPAANTVAVHASSVSPRRSLVKAAARS